MLAALAWAAGLLVPTALFGAVCIRCRPWLRNQATASGHALVHGEMERFDVAA